MPDSSPSAFLLLALQFRRLIAGFAVVGGLLGLASALLPDASYRTSTAFVVQERGSSLDGLAGLASQFGVRVPRGGSAMGPEFYRDLALARPTLEPILSMRFDPQDGSGERTLLQILELDGSLEENHEIGYEWLRESAIAANANRETGVVRVSATTSSPHLSAALAEAVFEQIRSFDLNTRTTQARAEREFLASRVDSARTDLAQSESSVQSFLEQNRTYQSSAALVVRHERLQRAVTQRQQLFSTLSQAFEQARIEEVRNAPAVTVLEPPALPVRREARGTVMRTLGGLLVGGFIGLLVGTALATVRDATGPNWDAIRASWRTLWPRRTIS